MVSYICRLPYSIRSNSIEFWVLYSLDKEKIIIFQDLNWYSGKFVITSTKAFAL